MTKRSKLAKKALKNPSLYTDGELSYFAKLLQEHKRAKSLKKQKQSEESLHDGNQPVDFR